MKLRRYVGTGAAVILLVAALRGTGAGVVPAPLPSIGRPPAPQVSRAVVGAGRCSAAACHGSVVPAAFPDNVSHVLRNEHTTWVTRDKHANAYSVLSSKRSKDMVHELGGGKAATEEKRCLGCHATGGIDPTASPVGVVRSDGVSCESCHGSAQGWLSEHTRDGWHNLPAAQKEQYGMRPTKELAQRAAICVDCHVGSPGRDMNHDLIAAGHPRLTFEFSAYLANMPPHWNENTGGNFPARAWAIGQAATAKAAADLLAHRASTPKESPWPEFSEYNCFACHHDLADQVWRQKSPPDGRKPGIPAWGSWNYPSALIFAPEPGQPGLGQLPQDFAALRTEMNHFAPPRGGAASAAKQVSQSLAQWLQTLPEETRSYDVPKVKALIDLVQAKDAPGPAGGWDGAAQYYLALQPLRLALKGLDPNRSETQLDSDLRDLFQALKYTPGYESPRGYNPALPFGHR